MNRGEGRSKERNVPIGSCTAQHFVDPQDVERVDANAKMEGIFPAVFRHILIGANTSGFEGFAGELFILVRNQMTAEGELFNGGTFPAQIKNFDLNRVEVKFLVRPDE